MTAAAGTQHRCVFVGNIPYDATEEQLIQICEEVGPVVSFRLVFDRETGKPKGYGFCEYKDEETALSARRNLQGYEINGRQLRVDFAENDKNADRNREQGRGGPGLASNADAQKQFSGAAALGDSAVHQPIGFPAAATAATVMAGALGGAQISTTHLQSQSGTGNDALTHYLSRLSRHQLHEIMSEMKALTTQNKTLARQLLKSCPQLTKALFQTQIMLGMVTPQMMQIATSGQSLLSTPQLSSNPGQISLQTASAKLSRPLDNQHLITSQGPGIQQQAMAPLQQVQPQPKYQLPPLPQSQILQATVPEKSRPSTVPSRWPQSIGNLPVQPSLSMSKGPISQSQPPLPQPSVPTPLATLPHNPQPALQNTMLQQPSLPHSLTSQSGTSNGALQVSASSAIQGSTWPSGRSPQSLGVGIIPDQTRITDNLSESIRPSKLQKLDGGTGTTQIMSRNPVVNNGSLQTLGSGTIGGSQVVADTVQHSEKQMLQLSPEVESALLQQVLSLTPEQLISLPLEQQQQVLHLQQMLSASK
ncbi:cleavage stimulating factor 64 isoform X1 [Canna indica]|uniref:Cleavage stimulating factor 64 isoform X1 n=1 Tax=Canna indica TaxID=4628 RepID=A0AAQ3KP17_9LILI|nr:cleavage stimulating factor 64 isoform X1 [Canna indica]